MFKSALSKINYSSSRILSSSKSTPIIIFNEQLSSQKTPKATKSSKAGKSADKAATSTSPAGDVPGLSSKILSVPSAEVGPGASKQGDYKNPEYFCYNPTSYFEAEIEMEKYRLPQPSSKNFAPK